MPTTKHPNTPAGILHVYGQGFQHDDLTIRGNRAGLTALRDALDAALGERMTHAAGQVEQNDGERFALDVALCDASQARALNPAYHDQLLHQRDPERAMRRPEEWARRVYIAGPMTGLAQLNFPAFMQAEQDLRAQGLHVENPARHGVHEWAAWPDYLRHDLGRLATCSQIFMLPGWSRSRGASLEMVVARALGLGIEYHKDAERDTQPAIGPLFEDDARLYEFLVVLFRDITALRACAKNFFNEIVETGAISQGAFDAMRGALVSSPQYTQTLTVAIGGEAQALSQAYTLFCEQNLTVDFDLEQPETRDPGGRRPQAKCTA